MRRMLPVFSLLLVFGTMAPGSARCATESANPAQAALPLPPNGPKKRIAVARSDASGAIDGQFSGWNIGDGLAAQLTTALVNSGHFIVVERGELAGVLREQEMAAQKIVSKETTTQIGRVLGAQFLVRGSVTEFSQSAGGGGVRAGAGTGIFGGGPFGGGIFGGGGLGGALGLQTTHGVVAMDALSHWGQAIIRR